MLTTLHKAYATIGAIRLAQDDHFQKLLYDVLIKLLCPLAAQNEREAEDEFGFILHKVMDKCILSGYQKFCTQPAAIQCGHARAARR